MSKDLKVLSTKDLEDPKTDSDGNLYWKGKRVRTGGWTTADRIALAAAIVAVLALLAGLAKDYDEILESLVPSRAADPGTALLPHERPVSPVPVPPSAPAPMSPGLPRDS